MRASCLAFCKSRCREISVDKKIFRSQGIASKRPATASGCGGAGPSAASPLLSDAQRHRLRRGSLHPTPRRSQRRSTPFFSTLLTMGLFSRGKDAPPSETPAPSSSPPDALLAALRQRLEETALHPLKRVASADLPPEARELA